MGVGAFEGEVEGGDGEFKDFAADVRDLNDAGGDGAVIGAGPFGSAVPIGACGGDGSVVVGTAILNGGHVVVEHIDVVIKDEFDVELAAIVGPEGGLP